MCHRVHIISDSTRLSRRPQRGQPPLSRCWARAFSPLQSIPPFCFLRDCHNNRMRGHLDGKYFCPGRLPLLLSSSGTRQYSMFPPPTGKTSGTQKELRTRSKRSSRFSTKSSNQILPETIDRWGLCLTSTNLVYIATSRIDADETSKWGDAQNSTY